MDESLLNDLKKVFTGDIETSDETLEAYSHDASIFKVKPSVVVFPKNNEDVEVLVTFVAENKKKVPTLSLTARAAGTDMSGGSINDSILVSFTRYFNHPAKIHGSSAVVQPGLYYRHFEKQTVEHGLLYPPYPSSREICAMGGIINNNAGGEKSLEYGKAEDYVEEMNMVLADGKSYIIKPLTEPELIQKTKQKDFEGEIYKKIYDLISNNYELIMKAKPDVSKNSAGYYLWNIYDREKKIFDLTKLFVGAQGTLGIMLDAKLRLVPIKKHSEMLIIYVRDLSHLAEIVNIILPFHPESLETYDDITLKLALKYFSGFKKKLHSTTLETFMNFLPEFKMKLRGNLPNLTLQAEFTGDSRHDLTQKIMELEEKLKQFNVAMKFAPSKKAEVKYWLIRRDSFNLLRKKIKNMYASPFIDDFIVKPEYLPEFLPKFNAILKKYPSIKATFAGHVGNGNFHVIPLVDLTKPDQQKLIPHICREVFTLVMQYKGSTSGEHNDGLVRTSYLELQYDKKILSLFAQVKEIFDPENIFNPRKKVNGDIDFAMSHVRTTW